MFKQRPPLFASSAGIVLVAGLSLLCGFSQVGGAQGHRQYAKDAQQFQAEGRDSMAAATYTKAWLNKKKPDYLFGRGISHMRLDQWRQAAQDFRQVLPELSGKQRAEALARLGLSHYKLGEMDTAAWAADSAMALQPDFAAAYYVRALAARERRDYDRALRLANRAVELQIVEAARKEEPRFNRATYLYYRGTLLMEDHGETRNACSDFRMARDAGHPKAEKALEIYCYDSNPNTTEVDVLPKDAGGDPQDVR